MFWFSVAVAFAAAVSCGKKSSDDDAPPSDPVASNPAALAYPTNLAISAFPSSTSTTLTLADAIDATPAAKKAEQEKLIRGEGESCLPKVMGEADKEGTVETCYEFDQDMISGTNPNGGTYGTATGKNSAGEACLPAFARAQVKRVVGHVDRSLGLAQMALCQRKKAGQTSQPAVGETIDLAEILKTAFANKGTVTTANLKRLADASDGAKVFTMAFDMTRPDGTPMVVNITHSPKNDANTAYTGVIYSRITEQKTGGGSESMTRLVSVMYERSDTTMKYNLRTARFASALVATAIAADGQVDFNTGAVFPGGTYTGYADANSAVSGMTSIAFEGNPTTNAGTFSYWQNPGGNYTERARGMLASLSYDEATKTLSGCATSGAAGSTSDGVSIRASIRDSKTLEPNGSYHPFFNVPNGSPSCGTVSSTVSIDTAGSFYFCPSATTIKWYVPSSLGANGTTFVTAQQPTLHTRQCFKQNTSGVYEIDTAQSTAAAGYELITTADTAKKISPPAKPTPGTGVVK
jgi:hypothetical protein